MVLDRIAEWVTHPRNIPNNLTWAMGEKIRDARQEAGLTQAELAERAHRRQAAISQIERGQMMLDVETLVYLAGVLDKPIRYFFPDQLLPRLEGELQNWEREYLENIRKLNATDRERVARYVDLFAALDTYEELLITANIEERLQRLDDLQKEEAEDLAQDVPFEFLAIGEVLRRQEEFEKRYREWKQTHHSAAE
jgi:transcriptional regulator with XRE-family HTH domain